jgi:uncharacterized protein (TIGR00299 family) protein
MRHIHLDPLGGVAGDMFVAAMLDAFPEHREPAVAAAQAASEAACRLVPHSDGTLAGARFEVLERPRRHAHAHWRSIRARLEASALPVGVLAHALGIFSMLADAEARVHGVAPDDVVFHEVGAADSIADIVAAAWLIDAAGPATWSVSSLPAGSGRVLTAHGPMPVPAPAAALLLEGFATHDDGIPGERVTPTGAAILRHLGCANRRAAGVLRQTGYGFGARKLPGISNCLRVLVSESETASSAGHRALTVVSFEVDDQSGEDLAAGLERIRAMEAVHDVVQMAAFGKKSRLAVHVQVLCRPDAEDAVVDACFSQTSTIGLRTHVVQGRALPRRLSQVEVDGHMVQVKLAERPGALTGKAEADHVLKQPDRAARERLRREAERLAMQAGS